MKKTINSLANLISDVQLVNLTRETKETLALDLEQSNNHIFTSADLWNIHRHSRPRIQRRFL